MVFVLLLLLFLLLLIWMITRKFRILKNLLLVIFLQYEVLIMFYLHPHFMFINCSLLQERVGAKGKATDALAGELWEKKRERIQKTSKWSSNPDWDLRSVSQGSSILGLCF